MDVPRVLVDLDGEEALLSWQEKPTGWPASLAAACLGVSLLAHLLLLMFCALFVISGLGSEPPQISTRFSDLDSRELAVENIDVSALRPPDTDPLDTPKMIEFAPHGMEPVLNLLDSSVEPEAGGEIGFRMPSGGKAVTQGSFTAWTVPEDPKPREDYLIVIQLKLPERIRNYAPEDLSGFLEGDDGYQTPIGSYRGRSFPKKYYGRFDMKARQFVIRIPGAAENVRDVIHVESRVLKEKQVLVIVF